MNSKLRLLFSKCFHLQKAKAFQNKVQISITYSTLTQRTLGKRPYFESRLIGYSDQISCNGKSPVPNGMSQLILIHQYRPQSNKDTVKSINTSDLSQKELKDDHTKIQTENADIIKDQSQEEEPGNENVDPKPQGLLQRFRQTYKEYGKVLVGVHIFTSCIWATSFYYVAVSGIDIIPLLQWLGASDKIIAPLSVPGVGHAAIAYLLYKLASPVRYAVTIAGTRLAVNVLRRWGHLPPIPEKNKIRSLVKEGQQKMKEKYDDIKKSNQDL